MKQTYRIQLLILIVLLFVTAVPATAGNPQVVELSVFIFLLKNQACRSCQIIG